MRSDESFRFWLPKIREHPAAFLGEKSLSTLMRFWRGYLFGREVEVGESAEIKLSEVEYKTYGHHFMDGFNEFVESYYNCTMGGVNGTEIISLKSNSEEAAFDKFFELLDEFFR